MMLGTAYESANLETHFLSCPSAEKILCHSSMNGPEDVTNLYIIHEYLVLVSDFCHRVNHAYDDSGGR